MFVLAIDGASRRHRRRFERSLRATRMKIEKLTQKNTMTTTGDEGDDCAQPIDGLMNQKHCRSLAAASVFI